MASRQLLFLTVSIAVGLAVVACKKTAAPAGGEDPLQAAIEIQGGLKKLKAGSSFTAAYEATLSGAKINGNLMHRTGAVRMEYVGPFGDPVVQVAAPDKCWQKLGKAIVPCHESIRKHSTRLAKLLEASWLWPLKERGGHKVKVEKVDHAGKAYDGLTVLEAGGDLLGTVLLDSTTSLVAGIKMRTTLMGKTGELVGIFTDFEKHCGIKMPMKREFTFADKPFSNEKLIGVICKDVDIGHLARPEQVKHGTVEIKHAYNTPMACTKLNGPYSGVRAAMDKVTEYILSKDLPPMGAAVLIHHKGPPKVKRPERYVTDVCFPVSKKAWVMPKSDWKGEFFLGDIYRDEVLVAFGVGDLDKTSRELPPLLLEAAKKRGRKPSGKMYQRVYMRPGDFPPDQCVTEMLLWMQ
jgi:hypothetical protein